MTANSSSSTPSPTDFRPLTDFPGNGLLRLPGGDFLTTWVGVEGGPSRGVSRYNRETGAVTANWAPVPRGEGLALSPDHRAVYTDDLFTGQIYRIPLDAPGRWTVMTTLPGSIPGPDDVATVAGGDLYVASHLAATIDRVTAGSGATCSIDAVLPSGLPGPSSVRVGPDGDKSSLYATFFDGSLRRLRPPADIGISPVQNF